jgi:zinc D-Ala-D-Ala carboxypeptidase
MNYQESLKTAKNMKLSKHFTLFDVIYSQTASNLNIDNIIAKDSIAFKNSQDLINNVLEKVFEHFYKYLTIESFYRCKILNEKIGGESNSQHTKGMACDFWIWRIPLKHIFEFIKNNLEFDQLILENIDPKKNGWIHVSFNKNNNRKECLLKTKTGYIKG